MQGDAECHTAAYCRGGNVHAQEEHARDGSPCRRHHSRGSIRWLLEASRREGEEGHIPGPPLRMQVLSLDRNPDGFNSTGSQRIPADPDPEDLS